MEELPDCSKSMPLKPGQLLAMAQGLSRQSRAKIGMSQFILISLFYYGGVWNHSEFILIGW
jgi:hypothetical protein